MGLPDERVRQVTNYLVGKSLSIIVGTHCTGILGIAALYNAMPRTVRLSDADSVIEL